MNFKNKILAASLSLSVLFSALGAEAAVTIKGKNLDNIDDIVETALGGERSAELRKYSLGLFNYQESAPGSKLGLLLIRFKMTAHLQKNSMRDSPTLTALDTAIPADKLLFQVSRAKTVRLSYG